MQHNFTLVGLLTGEPALLNGPRSTGLDLGFTHPYPQSVAGSLRINSTDLDPYVLNIDDLPSLHLLAIKILDGSSVVVRVTSAAGTDQEWPLSGLLVWHAPAPSDVLTSVALVGAAELEYMAAG